MFTADVVVCAFLHLARQPVDPLVPGITELFIEVGLAEIRGFVYLHEDMTGGCR